MMRWTVVWLLGCQAFAQAPCEVPNLEPDAKAATIFSPAQEVMLGDIAAEQIQQQMRIYPQAELTAPLERIAARLLQGLPASHYRFRFFLIEIPQANAFALPGGRIYVSRRLVAFVENEDELAGVIAHEMGHIVTRQASVNITRALHQVLRIDQVGDRDDIFRKFNQLLDNAKRWSESSGRERGEQGEADRVSLLLLWRAGYTVQAFPDFYDRLTENKGARGNVLTDLFGSTRPASKRFREMAKTLEAIPAACRERRPAPDDAAFQAWRKTVADLSREDLTVSASDLRPTAVLAPKMRPEIDNLKFSPDGSLLVAQDGSGVNVLQREPLKLLFRIPALEADPATFDRESRRVLLPAAGPRLEIWNVASQSRERMWQPKETQHCEDMTPSPDGRIVACRIGLDEIRLVDTQTDTEVGRHKFKVDPLTVLLSLLVGVKLPALHAEFSPDGASFVAGTSMAYLGSESWIFDPARRAEFAPGKPLRGSIGSGFAFTGPNRLVVINATKIRESGVYSWPEGNLLEQLTIPAYPITAAAKGAIVMLRPFQDYGVAALDLGPKEFFQASPAPAMDCYENIVVSERSAGEVALYPIRKTAPFATLQLPEADLGRLRSAALSPDLEWLVLSIRGRGALWNLKTGQSTLVWPFDGGTISAQGVWTTTFESWEKLPEKKGAKRGHFRSVIDLPRHAQLKNSALPEKDDGKKVEFEDRYEISMAPAERKGKTTLSVKDVVSGTELWTRTLDSEPSLHRGDTLVLEWSLEDKGAERIFKESPELKKKRDGIKNREGMVLAEALDLATGKGLGTVLIDTGSRLDTRATARTAGRTLFLEDRNRRTLAYSLDTGERLGQQFGKVLAVNAARGLVGVQNHPGAIVVFDSSMRRVIEYTLPGNVIYAGFDQPGNRLLAVTGSQEVFIEDVPR